MSEFVDLGELLTQVKEKITKKKKVKRVKKTVCDFCDEKYCYTISSLTSPYPTVLKALPEFCPLRGERDKFILSELSSLNGKIEELRQKMEELEQKKKETRAEIIRLEVLRSRRLKEYLTTRSKKIKLGRMLK